MRFVNFRVLKRNLSKIAVAIYVTLIQCNGLGSNEKFFEKIARKIL